MPADPRYGATPDAWRHFADTLGLTVDLLPLVCNPNAKIADRSTMKAIGKTPSVYDSAREVVGLGKWTHRVSAPADIARWSQESDYGICIQARTIRAIDIDVEDPRLANAIEEAVIAALDGEVLPQRSRSNSGKRLLAFRHAAALSKRVVPVEGGVVEFLADGQQFVAVGTHTSGVPYLWSGKTADRVAEFPLLSDADFDRVYNAVAALATGEPKIARARRERVDGEISVGADERAAWLTEHWDVFDTGDEGRLFLRCPFEDEHTGDSGITSTAYMLAGTGGYERGHWVCLHAHCMGRDDSDFDHRCGYAASGFSALPAPVVTSSPRAADPRPTFTSHDPLLAIADMEVELPRLVRDGQGKIEATADNLNKLLRIPEYFGMHLAEDTFRGALVWAPYCPDPHARQWREFADNDYATIEIGLERRGVKPIGHDALRRWVRKAASDERIDTAREWLARLRWDGVPRIEQFMIRYLGCANDNRGYNRAVGLYLWTALAGRVMHPGIQADMVPILYGPQGARKTSAIRAMVPASEHYTTIDLATRDDDTARLMRGTLVAELEELRGLKSRDAESIKAWVTKTADKWTPKYVEFAQTYHRRTVLIGTTNSDAFLGDDSGERRWLPVTVAVAGGKIDVEGIARDREQLWAEAAMRFAFDGIAWADAERLGEGEHDAFKATDVWDNAIARWLDEPDLAKATARQRLSGDGLTIGEIASGIGIPVSQLDRSKEVRIGQAMRRFGYVSRRVGVSRLTTWFTR